MEPPSQNERVCGTEIIKKLEESKRLINPHKKLLQLGRRSGVRAVIPDHYSARANRIVARALADFIAKERTHDQTPAG